LSEEEYTDVEDGANEAMHCATQSLYEPEDPEFIEPDPYMMDVEVAATV